MIHKCARHNLVTLHPLTCKVWFSSAFIASRILWNAVTGQACACACGGSCWCGLTGCFGEGKEGAEDPKKMANRFDRRHWESTSRLNTSLTCPRFFFQGVLELWTELHANRSELFLRFSVRRTPPHISRSKWLEVIYKPWDCHPRDWRKDSNTSIQTNQILGLNLPSSSRIISGLWAALVSNHKQLGWLGESWRWLPTCVTWTWLKHHANDTTTPPHPMEILRPRYGIRVLKWLLGRQTKRQP